MGRAAPRRFAHLFAIALGVVLLLPEPAWAIPGFARRQNMGCPVCHTTPPELNAFGSLYQQNGYRLPAEGAPVTTGADLGLDTVIDQLGPGLSIILEGDLASFDGGTRAVTSKPLGGVEVLAGGAQGSRLSYFVELEAEANEEALHAAGMALVRAHDWATLFFGIGPTFAMDVSNTLTPGRRISGANHGVTSYRGALGGSLAHSGSWIGVRGGNARVFYLLEAGPGPNAELGDDFDYAARVLARQGQVAAGVFGILSDNGSGTLRAGADVNWWLSKGTVRALVAYDTAEGAVLGELHWSGPAIDQAMDWFPWARVDARYLDTGVQVTPSVGLALAPNPTGRLQVEVSEPITSGGVGLPDATLGYFLVF